MCIATSRVPSKNSSNPLQATRRNSLLFVARIQLSGRRRGLTAAALLTGISLIPAFPAALQMLTPSRGTRPDAIAQGRAGWKVWLDVLVVALCWLRSGSVATFYARIF
jgi:hypothetical protein